MTNIGIVGLGNMGGAIAKGLLKSKEKFTIFAFDLDKKKADSFADMGAVLVSSVKEMTKKCTYIIVAVKPNVYFDVLKTISEGGYSKTVITIAPGISIESVKSVLPECRVVRTMPNTPALISMGVTLIANNKDEDMSDIKEIFSSVGEVYLISEKMMNAGVSLSGSSPAYVYMFINAIADGAAALGIPKKSALEIAANTVIGSALMVLKSEKHPMELLDNVCSPGGTTIEAVNSLKEQGFDVAIVKAMKACEEKSRNIK